MDEEADFANILSQSTIQKPTWSTTPSDPSSDPWANPFSTSSPTNPFASSTSAFGSTSAYVPTPAPAFSLDSPEQEVSPYVAKLEEDDRYGRGNLPDPPSVIAAREQEASEAEAVFGNPYAPTELDPFTVPYSPPKPAEAQVEAQAKPSRKLPSGLIDEDLMAASDPSISLKKAFVKSTPAPRPEGGKVEGKKAYVFTPGKPAAKATKKEDKVDVKGEDKVETVKEDKNKDTKSEVELTPDTESATETAAQNAVATNEANTEDHFKTGSVGKETKQPVKPAPNNDKTAKAAPQQLPEITQSTEPESIPLPPSGQATPSISRIASPVSANGQNQDRTSSLLSATNDIFSANSTPKHDRVAVSPLDPPPPAEKDYGFHHLAIGGSSQPVTAPPPPPKTSSGWSQPSTAATGTGSRFAGKGWAAVDDSDDLFGPGGPSSKSDPWGGEDDAEGWAGDNVPTMSGPSQVCS